MNLTPTPAEIPIKADPFRRSDVHYTTVSWTCPVTGEERTDSIPVTFLVTFFSPKGPELVEYLKERRRWLMEEVS